MKLNPVEIPKSHRNEWKSKRNFEEVLESMKMFMPSEWVTRDYGIDGIVELASSIKDSESLTPNGHYFTLQLKSTEKANKRLKHIAFAVPVKKIIQWHSSNLAVAFILNNFSDGMFYYLWIDDDLISSFDAKNENWVNKKTNTLKIPFENVFSEKNNDIIREYILKWKPSSRKIIQPGVYFSLKEKSEELLGSYKTITSEFKFESINSSIVSLDNQLEKAIYRIAITGPSRVGKSTLINALLKRRGVSPTGFFQTTGVPIQILPGKDEEVKVIFKDNTSKIEKLTPEIIEQYASQEENEDNKKNVALVAIHLANKQLEHGVSLFDIPGLDDPDDEIYNYTWNTVTKANAILYLIDASSAEHGGFIFRKEYKKHILELGQSLDKIFLVFNKVNVLTGDKLERLKERVNKDLKRYNLYENVADKIYYISAEESLKSRLGDKKATDSIEKLEKDIWNYLLSENKIGLIRLHNVCKQVLSSTKDFEGILNTRLIDNNKRKELEEAIQAAKKSTSNIGKLYNEHKSEIKERISKSLENRKNNILLNLEDCLKSIKTNEKMLSKKQIRNYLTQAAHNTLQQTNKEYAHQINILQQTIDNWIEDNLKEVRKIILKGARGKSIDLSEVENIELPDSDMIASFGVGFLTGIIGLMINPPVAIVTAITGFFSSFFFSAADRRAKQIDQIIDKSRRQYDSLFRKINSTYMSSVNESSKHILDYANAKIKTYFSDLKKQLEKLEKAITKEEEKQYEAAFSEVEILQKKILDLNKEIESWYRTV